MAGQVSFDVGPPDFFPVGLYLLYMHIGFGHKFHRIFKSLSRHDVFAYLQRDSVRYVLLSSTRLYCLFFCGNLIFKIRGGKIPYFSMKFIMTKKLPKLQGTLVTRTVKPFRLKLATDRFVIIIYLYGQLSCD